MTTPLVDHRKPVNIIFWDFCRAFNAVSYNILLDKMPSIQLDKNIMRVSNWLMGFAQSVIVSGVTSASWYWGLGTWRRVWRARGGRSS